MNKVQEFTNCGDSIHTFSELEFVEYSGFTGGVKPQHQNALFSGEGRK